MSKGFKSHLVIPDAHAHFAHNNDRAILIGKLINDCKPDVVIDLGDTGDFPSLSSYDKGKRSFYGRSYAADVSAHNDYQDKLWHVVKSAKRKLPLRVRLIGNHEERIGRVCEMQPELSGTVDYGDLDLDKYYDIVVPYSGNTPGVIEVDGIHYAHYFTSGVLGKPVSGEHPAHALLQKKFISCTQGHNHTFDFKPKTRADGKKIYGMLAGCFIDYDADWPGETQKMWDRGVVLKTCVEDGTYNHRWISIGELKDTYK